MHKNVITALLFMLLLGCDQNLKPNDIAKFSVTLQGKSPEQIRDMIEKEYGPPDRNVGSGLVIEQWDVDGGTLTFHPLVGPSFDNGQTVVRLMETTNLLKHCLFGSYEMHTLPDAEIHGNQFWIGNVSMTGSKYEFSDSESNLRQRIGQESNYFIKHPVGTVKVSYAENITAETKLEELDNQHVVATLEFSSADGTSHGEFEIVADTKNMRLSFQSEAIPFRMEKGWVSYWD
ncbi:MAG: hypothetical protein AAGG48_31015 [Planctomycetota bacterium]